MPDILIGSSGSAIPIKTRQHCSYSEKDKHSKYHSLWNTEYDTPLTSSSLQRKAFTFQISEHAFNLSRFKQREPVGFVNTLDVGMYCTKTGVWSPNPANTSLRVKTWWNQWHSSYCQSWRAEEKICLCCMPGRDKALCRLTVYSHWWTFCCVDWAHLMKVWVSSLSIFLGFADWPVDLHFLPASGCNNVSLSLQCLSKSFQ